MATEPSQLDVIQGKIAAGEALSEEEQRFADASAIYVHEPASGAHPSAAVPPPAPPPPEPPPLPPAATGVAVEDAGPVPPAPSGGGYLIHDDFAGWVAGELVPRLQSLIDRQDALEEKLGAMRSDVAAQVVDRIGDPSAVHAEWAETFNRFSADLNDRLSRDEAAIVGLEAILNEHGHASYDERLAALEQRPSVAPETIDDLQKRLAALEQSATTPGDGG